MDHYPPHSRRTYMDDRVYRSAPASSLGYSRMLVDPRTPRYSPSLYDESLRTGYFDTALEDDRSRHARSPYERGFYGYEPETQWGSDELVRRTNREAAIANSGIRRPSHNVQLHPMMTPDGRYPPSFNLPCRIEELVRMDPYSLDQIMKAYELGATRRRYYQGSLVSRFEDHDPFNRSNSSRIRDFIALFEFLGAYRLVDHLQQR
ncbi:hypothetical protein B0A54_05700 [Friedmanniomyces endolithicus]|uniref:Uncharacterized protein n=1 Tax=Friedmanniomyces endolithicus TaxID=329885 RepID=A0A4V5N8K4_9PEZI|nr:hypothetical protein LTS09_015294 [Friedmanniomyces endolithicus]TKA43939.1 hypothetical protein B0A54_05700 [Friedmanniomyces endolithicus]